MKSVMESIENKKAGPWLIKIKENLLIFNN